MYKRQSNKPIKSVYKNVFYIGDAFYTFPPTLAQGASQAIEAANEILRIADVEFYDLSAMKVEMDHTSHPIVPLVRAMDEKCGGENGRYIHWGATTQNITQTGHLLLFYSH